MSSGSWSGGGGADILDLDRYMRPRSSNRANHNNNGAALVVDSGGAGMMRAEQSNSISSVSEDMVKRYSHDSGVSDESPRPARARNSRNRHDRSLSSDNYQRATRRSSHKRPRDSRDMNSGREDEPSLRAFRAECEKALREHKEQLQRVADICERLTSNQLVAGGNIQAAPKKHQQVRSLTLETLSSTSCSSMDGFTDKHPKDECKTYKIILNKLDELNRLFKSKAVVRPPQELRKGLSPLHAASDTVTVSDKVVATDPTPGLRCRRQSPNMNSVDIKVGVRDNRDVKCTNRFEDHSSGDECLDETGVANNYGYPFNLEDPIQLYSQAKQLQSRDNQCNGLKDSSHEKSNHHQHHHSESMCAFCRRYWLSIKEAFFKKYWKC